MSTFILALNSVFCLLFGLGILPYFNDGEWNPVCATICLVFLMNCFYILS